MTGFTNLLDAIYPQAHWAGACWQGPWQSHLNPMVAHFPCPYAYPKDRSFDKRIHGQDCPTACWKRPDHKPTRPKFYVWWISYFFESIAQLLIYVPIFYVVIWITFAQQIGKLGKGGMPGNPLRYHSLLASFHASFPILIILYPSQCRIVRKWIPITHQQFTDAAHLRPNGLWVSASPKRRIKNPMMRLGIQISYNLLK